MEVREYQLKSLSNCDLQTLFEKHYSLNILYPLYCETILPLLNQPIPKKKPLKKDIVDAFFSLSHEQLNAWLNQLDPEHTELLTQLVWYGDNTVSHFEKELGLSIADEKIKKDRYGYTLREIDWNNPFSLILYMKVYIEYYSTTPIKNQYIIALPLALRSWMREWMNKPQGYYFEGIKEVDQELLRFRADEVIADDFKLIANYIEQGHLQFNKNETISRKSIKAIMAFTRGGEFFEQGSAKLAYVRNELMVNLLAAFGPSMRKSMQEDTPDPEKIVRHLLQEIFRHPEWIHEHLLTHVRPVFYSSKDYDADVMSTLWELLRQGNEEEWITSDNLIKYTIFHVISLDLFARYRVRVRVNHQSPAARYRSSSIDVSDENLFELVHEPLLKGAVFMLAALGMAEIAYTEPLEHPEWWRSSETYLTPFDGLKAFRLTPLGAYALGIRDEVSLKTVDRAKVELLFNLKRLTATCRNIDPVTEMTLLEYMEKVSPGCYRMTRKQLMKGCSTPRELEKRIALFRSFVPAELPVLWKNFLDELASNAVGLQKETAYSVYKLSDLPELRALFVNDPELRTLSVRVEGLRVAIKKGDAPAVKRRLKLLGFLMP